MRGGTTMQGSTDMPCQLVPLTSTHLIPVFTQTSLLLPRSLSHSLPLSCTPSLVSLTRIPSVHAHRLNLTHCCCPMERNEITHSPSACASPSGYGTQEESEMAAAIASPSSFLFSSALASPRYPAPAISPLRPLDLSPKRTPRADGKKPSKRAGKRLQHSASLVTPSTLIEESASPVRHSGGEGSPEPGLLEGRKGGNGAEGSKELGGGDGEGHKVHRRKKKDKEGRNKGHRREEEEARRSDRGEEERAQVEEDDGSPSNHTNKEMGFSEEQQRHSQTQQQQQQQSLASPLGGGQGNQMPTPSPKPRHGPRISIKLSDNGRCVGQTMSGIFLVNRLVSCLPNRPPACLLTCVFACLCLCLLSL